MIPIDPTDKRLRERTSASFIVSLIIHALVALLFFSVITSSSEQASPETSEGSAIVIVSHVHVSRTKSVPPVVQPPVSRAPRVGKPLVRPVLAGHPPVPRHRELAKQNPSAPPNPTPAPLAPFSPNPQPSQVAIVTPAPAEIPAVTVSVPSAPPLIAPQRRATAPPTVAPPTAAPTVKASPAAVAQATASPSKTTPQPSAAPKAAPTAASAAATSAPTKAPATSAPRAAQAASPAPQKAAGVASPAPTGAPSPSAQRGRNASPGPKPLAQPGAVPVKARTKPQPQRPISLPPTPAPKPTVRPRPAKTLSPAKQRAYGNLNDRLKGLIPNGPVAVHVGHYTPKSYATFGYPTPPPAVLAATKFLYENQKVKSIFRIFGGHEQHVVMYVTAVKRHGAFSTCTGWLIRFPDPPDPYRSSAASGPFHGGPVTSDNPGPPGENGYVPVVEPDVTFECETSRLTPFSAPGAPSPGP